MKSLKAVISTLLLVIANSSFAGVDLTGTVTGVQQAPDGTLYFAISSTAANTYCMNHWAGLNMLIPAGDPNYAYYYGLLVLAMSKAKTVYLGNMSVYNGTTPCDVTKTGYGVMVLP